MGKIWQNGIFFIISKDGSKTQDVYIKADVMLRSSCFPNMGLPNH